MGLVYFKTPGSQVVGMTEPLHPAIEKQWQAGELQRVNEDGSPWQVPALAEPAPGGDGGADAAPARPADSARRADWARYAVAIGACTGEEAGKHSRAELIDLVTPPEAKPADA